VAQARQIVIWYRMRWTIEQVLRSLKSHGLRIEDSQMEEAGCFTKLALIAAVRSMQLVLARDGSTGQPVTDAADPADMPPCVRSTPVWKGAPRSLRTRTTTANSHGTPGSLPGMADAPATPPAATSHRDPKQCIVGCCVWIKYY
jgi:hypothetical protein